MVKTMMMTSKPNFSKAVRNAEELLLSQIIPNGFPFKAKKLIKDVTGIPCLKFAKAKEYGVNIDAFGSDSALLFELNGRNIIFYDETKPREHNIYSILHELGHIINDHNMKCNEIEYGIQEVETNFFVAQLLMPEQIIKEFRRRGQDITIEFLKKNFGVSTQAAFKRLETMERTYEFDKKVNENNYDEAILIKYLPFIDKTVPQGNELDWYENDYEQDLERDGWR